MAEDDKENKNTSSEEKNKNIDSILKRFRKKTRFLAATAGLFFAARIGPGKRIEYDEPTAHPKYQKLKDDTMPDGVSYTEETAQIGPDPTLQDIRSTPDYQTATDAIMQEFSVSYKSSDKFNVVERIGELEKEIVASTVASSGTDGPPLTDLILRLNAYRLALSDAMGTTSPIDDPWINPVTREPSPAIVQIETNIGEYPIITIDKKYKDGETK